MTLVNKILPGFEGFSRLAFLKQTSRVNDYASYRNVLGKSFYSSVTEGNASTKEPLQNNLNNFVTFDNMILERRKEAQRSYVVQVNSENSCSELYDYCQSKCEVNSMFYYTENDNHFVLVEFSDPGGGEKLCCHNSHGQSGVSPFVWFRAVKEKKGVVDSSKRPRGPLPVNIGAQLPTEEQIQEWLSVTQSLSDDMEILYSSTKLSELGIRLRMICARQVEMTLSGLYPNARAIPFGSTVNSFGKEGCDLDLVLRYGLPQEEAEDKRFVYHSKSNGVNSRGQTQRQMELLGDILQIHVPGVVGVKRILGARVPIIKYSHNFTGIDTDISLSNLSAVYMSELLYLFGNLDPAGQRVVFTIKAWAKAVGLTSPTPGRWITNFSLTLLVLFYLQQEKRLPTVDQLIRGSGKEDERFADDVNCTFLRDLKRLNIKLDQRKSQADLLLGFFNYYQGYDFDNKVINLCSGQASSKPDYSPLYIVNPLERSLNVSKNVSLDEVERFRIETRNALWVLENKGRLKDFFQNSNSRLSNRKYVPRLVTVRDLFS